MDKRSFFSFLCAIIAGFLVFTAPVYAATTPTPTKTLSAVADAEIERQKQLIKELSLNMPNQTEDPNYPITFTDPSKQGVDITVDEKTTTKAPNPFLLPNLSIGEHKVIFKFKTKDGIVRVLSTSILVTPKAPQFDSTLKTEVVKPASVTVKGTALPQATIMLVVNSKDTHKITATTDGKWEFILPDPKAGTLNIMAFAIKDGVVSSPSKTYTVEYKLQSNGVLNPITAEVKENPVVKAMNTLIANINANRVEQPYIFYGAIVVAILIILVMLDIVLRKKAAKTRDEKTIAALFGTMQKDGGTIVEAIQSSKEATTKKKGSKKAAKVVEEPPKQAPEGSKEIDTKDKKTSEQPKVAPTITPVEPVVSPEKLKETAKILEPLVDNTAKIGAGKFQIKKPSKPMKEKDIQEVIEEKSEDEETTEEPEKKVLSKEEFLKQFQKGGEQGE